MQLNRDLNLISKTNCKSKAKSKDIVNFSSLFNQVALKNFTKIDMDILFLSLKKYIIKIRNL